MIDYLWVSLPSVLFVLPLLFLVLIRTQQKRRQERRGRSPLTGDLLREPGHGLRQQIEDARFDVGTALGTASGWLSLPAFAGLLWAWRESRPLGWQDGVMAGCTFLLVAGSGLRDYLRATRKLHPLQLGWEAEVAVGQELNQLMLSGYRVYHDIQASNFNIDHVVVGPNGVFAVETKGRSKPHGEHGHKVRLRDDSLHFPNHVDRDSLGQAERQADWLAKRLTAACGEPVQVMPALVLPGWFIMLEQRPKFPLLSGKQVRSQLPKWGRITLGEVQINRIAHQLEQMSLQADGETAQSR